MRKVFVLLAACGPAAHPAPQHASESVEIAAPTVPRAEFAIAPAELADKDAWTRIRHRTRIARQGPVTFVIGGKRVDDAGGTSRNTEQPIYPVIGESGDKIRIVAPEDGARVALWIQRSDAATTALAPVRVGDDRGRADKTSGIWLGAGANIDTKPAANGLRAVALHSPYVDGSGYVPEAALGEVWVAGEHEAYDPMLASTSEPAPVSTGSELAVGPIRVAPDGAVIATTKDVLPVRVVATAGAWDEVEVHVVRVRVHGFVPVAAVSKPPDLHSMMGTGYGSAYGISDTSEVDVPAGVCLYDRAGGEVIGVEDAPKKRYSHGMSEPGWAHAYIGNAWGLMSVYLRDTTGGKDMKKASWEMCTK